jgi:ABC-type transport system involved in multi-copper enzyme maturation permease subunit
MGNAVRSEFRKIFTTKLWWALLIPAVVVGFLANLGFAAVQEDAAQAGELGVRIPIALLSLGFSFGFTTIFAAIFGAMAVSGEFRHRTIGVTYLTGQSRGAVLAAKLVAYGVMGLVYGVMTLIFATIGALAGGGSNALPSAGAWLLVSLVGIVIIALLTVLGVGLGGLISNQTVVVVVLLAYTLVGEAVLRVLLQAMKIETVVDYLPITAGRDSLETFSLDRFLTELAPTTSQSDLGRLRDLAGVADLPAWWATGLAFLGYVVVFVLAGWAVSRRRDIS